MNLFDIAFNITDTQYQGRYHHHQRQYHEPDLQSVFSRASNAGLSRILGIGCDLEDSKKALSLATDYSSKTDINIFVTVGCHPTKTASIDNHSPKSKEGRDINKENFFDDKYGEDDSDQLIYGFRDPYNLNSSDKIFYRSDYYFTAILELIKASDKVLAIGECGLDYDRLNFSPKHVQLKYFKKHLQLVDLTNLPLYLHDRNTDGELVNILKHWLNQKSSRNIRGVVHSFTGTFNELSEYVKLGLYIGINGCSLKTEENLENVSKIPLDKLLLETDAPWCDIRRTHASYKFIDPEKNTSVWKSGIKIVKKERHFQDFMVKGRNEPTNLRQVLQVVARLKGIPEDELAEKVWENSNKLFNLK